MFLKIQFFKYSVKNNIRVENYFLKTLLKSHSYYDVSTEFLTHILKISTYINQTRLIYLQRETINTK